MRRFVRRYNQLWVEKLTLSVGSLTIREGVIPADVDELLCPLLTALPLREAGTRQILPRLLKNELLQLCLCVD